MSGKDMLKQTWTGMLALVLGGMLLLLGPAYGQEPASRGGAPAATFGPSPTGPSADPALDDMLSTGQLRTISVAVGQSRSLRTPWRIKRVSVGDPKIADVQVLGSDRVLIQGMALGLTDLAIWNEQDAELHVRLDVRMDMKQFEDDLRRIFPNAKLRLTQSQGVYVISGTLDRAEQASQLHKLLEQSGAKFADMTQVAGVQQVQLQVRVAEVSRTAIKALGVNILKAGEDFFGASLIGSSSGGALTPVSIGPPKDAAAFLSDLPFVFNEKVTASPQVTLIAGFPGSDLEFFLQALAENQYLKVLSEPTLMALSGEEASFLAGGEFPIPVVQGTSGAGISISIEYKEFGVRLKFQPTVLGDNTIRMRVAPEVSDLTDLGAVEIEGFRIPSLVTRRADTTLEMNSGQMFVIAGLLNQRVNGRSSRVPLLGSIPLLGTLFRTVRYEKAETELIVLVKASLVEPSSRATSPPLPGEGDRPVSDWELYALGRVEPKDPTVLSAAEAAWLREKGLDKLHGPGAWATHDKGVERSRAPITPPAPPAQ